MKNLLILVFLFVAIPAFSQDSTSRTITYKNEFGIDVTGLIQQFFHFDNSTFPSYYEPNYILAYRRHMKRGNIRFGLGGDGQKKQIAPYDTADDREYFNMHVNIGVRLGWEFQNDISKRWQLFYGLDCRPSYYHSLYDAPYSNGGYYNGQEATVLTLGIAPVIGFRFRINDRISLYTESSFSVQFERADSRRYYLPYNASYPPIQDDVKPTLHSIYGRFTQPLSIFIAFDI